MNRTEKILRHVARHEKILELGPSFSPIAPKANGWNSFSLDHLATEALREKYRAQNLDVSRIEEVDFVWTDGLMEDCVPSAHHGTFDACIASHVVEHMPDLIAFFASMERLLTTKGTISLAIPDKRFSFDYFQALTLTGDVLESSRLRRTRHAKKTVFNAAAYAAKVNEQIAWSQHPVENLRLVSSLDAAKIAYDAHDESAGTYVDFHAMCFTPSSFELVVLELGWLKLVDFRIVDRLPTEGCEFFATLARGRASGLTESDLGELRLALLKQVLVEIREQSDYLLAGPSAPRARSV